VNNLKKFSNQKEISKIAKTTLAMVLAGSFTFSASNAFADGPAPSDQTQTVQTDTTATVQPTEKQQVPSLLPGDFFYFAKMALEKIQLALTFDNTKEAKLLAENAAERLAEAEALFSDGKQQEAVNTIKEALKAMTESDKLVKDQQGNTDETSTADDPKKADGSTTTPADGQTTTDDQKTTGKEATTNGQGTTTTNDNQPSDGSQATENDGVKEVKNVLSQNIIALKAALEHVKNPVARAALQKNIDKSYAKLAKKLDKSKEHVAKKNEEEAQKSVENNDATKDATKDETSGDNQTQATTAVSNNQAVVNATTPVTHTDVSIEQKNATVTKQEHQQSEDKVQTVQKAAHHELKQVQQKQEEVKSIVKQKKEESRSKVEETPKTKIEHKVQMSQGEHEGNHGNRH
jgi:hypothetical protein